ncbi:MAG: Ribonucleoside-diphosphate reductase 1 subunit alpha [Chlamydiae bacterium]|nr:Ribonucleoside-diphosphate reductase 1 subunit alpha [Chlamydiota bacterium]
MSKTATQMTIVKRNGNIVPFKGERIVQAIEAAFKETKGIAKEAALPKEDWMHVLDIGKSVQERITEMFEKGTTLTVEGIQDLVEVTLMDQGFHHVAKAYILYRDERAAKRAASQIEVHRKGHTEPVKFNPIKVASKLDRLLQQSTDFDEAKRIASVNFLVQKITNHVTRLHETQEISAEDIQNIMEKILAEEGLFTLAKMLIIEHTQHNTEIEEEHHTKDEKIFMVTTHEGQTKKLYKKTLKKRMHFAAKNLNVDVDALLESALLNFYEGIKEEEVDQAIIMAAKAKIEEDPVYSKFAARLLLDKTYREVLGYEAHDKSIEKVQRDYFKTYFKQAVSDEFLSPKILDFDLEKLGQVLDFSRDLQFDYLGMQTLYDRYFIHKDDVRQETPQIFWMRVAMGLSIDETEKEKWAIEFYNVLSKFEYLASTPTLFNSATNRSQLSSCFLSTVQDDLIDIFKTISDDARLSKWAGGLGNDWTNVRATGAWIKGTNGKSQGVIPFLKVANDTAVAVNQGGKRKGALCCYLETWHLDIEDFLELRKNTGDERRRTHDMNTANWIPDLFMKRVQQKGTWTLFSPSDVPDLHDLYGQAFETRYMEYEKMADDGTIKLFKRMDAFDLWRKMLSMLFETGHPWITFKDPSNIRSPQDHCGVVHSSNLCTEILLNTSQEETAVCNLGSVNLAEHFNEKGLDTKKLEKTITTAIRMLDNVININFYPIEQTEHANSKHRPIGLGLMGFQDILYMQNISYASYEAVQLADQIMENMSYFALLASSKLAQEKGTYFSYKGSKWERGYLPLDTQELLKKERGEAFVDLDFSSTLDWSVVRESIKKHGMRNSNCMAIAPTATIANIAGITASIEPTYKHLFVKSNLSGEFTVPNNYLVNKLKKLNMWDDEMIDDLKYFDGSIQEIARIPQEIKQVFLTAFEIEAEWLIDAAAKRQKWIDMGQSLNLYLDQPSGKKMSEMYMLAWQKGLKTTYYCRTLGATQVEKSTTDINKRGLQPRWMKNESPSARVQVNRDAPSCSLDEGCESCQ